MENQTTTETKMACRICGQEFSGADDKAARKNVYNHWYRAHKKAGVANPHAIRARGPYKKDYAAARTETGLHKCEQCGRGFKNEHALAVHTWRRHTTSGKRTTKKIVAYNRKGLSRRKRPVVMTAEEQPNTEIKISGAVHLCARCGEATIPMDLKTLLRVLILGPSI